MVKINRHARGQSAVELAACLPLLILMLVGLLDLGRAFNAYIVITNAAREGAYYGSVHPIPHSAVQSWTVSEAHGSGVALSTANVTVESADQTGVPIKVSIDYDFPFLTPILGAGQSIPLHSSAEMMVR